METTPQDLSELSIAAIARLIVTNWGRHINFAAKPYLEAMLSLQSINDKFGEDSGRSIVGYFLCNARTWRGDLAKIVKAELKRRVG